MRELETLLGMTLVERTRRVVRFTPLGIRIADKARRVLREAEELADMARAEAQPLTGELRMGVIPTIAPFLLPAILPRLRARCARNSSSSCAKKPARRRATRSIAGSSTASCWRCLSRAATSRSIELFDDALFVAFPRDEASRPQSIAPERDRRAAGCCCWRTAIA